MKNQEIKVNLNFLKHKYVLVYLVILIAIPLSVWLAKNHLSAVLGVMTKSLQSPKPAQSDAALIAEISRIINLPKGETPIIGTVADLSKLAGQPFFAQAKLGDKILIYKQLGVAYLYDPSLKKIINVGKVDGSAGSPSPEPSAASPEPSTSLIEKPASPAASR